MKHTRIMFRLLVLFLVIQLTQSLHTAHIGQGVHHNQPHRDPHHGAPHIGSGVGQHGHGGRHRRATLGDGSRTVRGIGDGVNSGRVGGGVRDGKVPFGGEVGQGVQVEEQRHSIGHGVGAHGGSGIGQGVELNGGAVGGVGHGVESVGGRQPQPASSIGSGVSQGFPSLGEGAASVRAGEAHIGDGHHAHGIGSGAAPNL